jgi:hypothetical protein
MLSLGTAQVMLGLALGSYDQRRHIPGHLFFKALVAAPGLVQLLYLVPLYRAVQGRQHHGLAWGLCVGASFVALANGALLWVNHLVSHVD